MILAIDVYYEEQLAKVVGILFNWKDDDTKEVFITHIEDVEEYQSGQFYKRELPCILELLKKIEAKDLECIIVDGHVFIDNDKNFGLGGYLYESLEKKLPVIGVAKKSFFNTENVSFPVYRGMSNSPLFVSSIGIDNEHAIEKVKNMHGKYRIPTLLKKLDGLTKS